MQCFRIRLENRAREADVEKVKEATRIAKELRPDLKLEGPIQYDAAVDPEVAKVKLPESEVAGHATVFIFPDLNAGNNAYKAVQRAANAVAIGPVLQGLNKPVNDLSRGALVTDIVNTIAITAIQAQTEGVTHMKVAVINCGSSSIKYEVFGLPEFVKLATGLIEKIGAKRAVCGKAGAKRTGLSTSRSIRSSWQITGKGSSSWHK